ncbi:histone-like nucleoid-structuring protein [Luteimonas dalianensis]|uniref:histone-like nucleoid-structuring protein n=1 Tax=Luteimonas dalianensis TaxID=1148196 RepID=UPI003BF3A627
MADLESLKQKHATTTADAKKLEREIARLERDAAKGKFPEVMATLNDYAKHFSESQKRRIVASLGLDDVAAAPTKRGGKAAAGKGKGSAGTVPPKFMLPDGTTWAGRGQIHKAFAAWGRSAEGRQWRKDNPGEKWPSNPNAPAGNTVAKKAAKKATKKPAKKTTAKRPAAKKTAKKAVKKAVKKSVRKKATKKAA